MESKVNCLKATFEDFYGSGQSNVFHFTGPEYTVSSITPTSNNVYVHDCVFHFCSSSSHGGAVYCHSNNNVIKLLVCRTSFISCKASNRHGGTIYFDSRTSGECIFSKTCGFNCSSIYSESSWGGGQFAYTFTKSDVNAKNHVNDSSFTHTTKDNIYSERVLRLEYGNILCLSVNITNNECYYCPAMRCNPTGSSSSDTYCISFSSIVNNTANGNYGCIYLTNSGSSPLYCIDTCNILNNKQTSSDCGTIQAYTNVFIKDSCILGNNENNKVFYTSYKITISNCTIDGDIFSNGRYYGSVTVNKSIESSFINALSHISTQYCDSYFDSYGTLTAKPNVPSKIPRLLMSCNCKCPMIDPLRYIQFIFLLTFLPSDPANDYNFY
jgi:hypothetical protein